MTPSALIELLQLYPHLTDLIALISRLTNRSAEDTRRELEEHLAARIFFLLLGEVSSATNYEILSERISSRLQVEQSEVINLVDLMAKTIGNIDAAGIRRRSSLRDLPHTLRREIFSKQGNRCGICGWSFSSSNPESRSSVESQPTLDHKVPYRIGGDRDENLWIICGLCNSVKAESIHVGERGRVWIDNYVYLHSPRLVAFWTFIRDRKCKEADCDNTPTLSRMLAKRPHNKGAWVLDNCVTRCEQHVRMSDVLTY